MTKDEMKLEKFKSIVHTIRKSINSDYYYIFFGWKNGEGKIKSPLEVFVDRNSENPYMEFIFNEAYIDYGDLHYLGGSGMTICVTHEPYGILGELKDCYHATKYYFMMWLIMLVAIDNDNYNKNLNIVSDVAYCLGITEDNGLNDCIIGVKGILKGEDIATYEYKNDVAREMFERIARNLK